ncbi:MAG: hypothetical protein K5888_05165, partial [Lachnospiraceae bacterium]|nr:hypothetical protein [Lachnospiraceae bacterium]
MKNKVLVAMGIGIFAALTFNATSVTTLAEDGNPQPQEPEKKEEIDNTLADSAQQAAGAAENALEGAVKTITGEPAAAGDTPEMQEEEKGTNEAAQDLEQAADQVLGLDPNVGKGEDEPTKEEKITEATTPAAEALNNELTDGDWIDDYSKNYKGDNEPDESKTPVGGDPDFKTPLDDINGKGGLLDQMENQDNLAGGKAGEIANKAGEINGKVDAADSLVNEAENLLPDDLVSNGSNFVESASSALANADTPEQADEILESANQVVNGINQQIEGANNRIAAIDSELSALKTEHQNLVGQYNDKKKELEAFENKFQDLK